MVLSSYESLTKPIGFLVVCAAVSTAVFFRAPPHVKSTTILQIFARSAFDWKTSTTPAPLSLTAVLVKKILAGQANSTPGLEEAADILCGPHGTVLDVKVASVRDFLSSRILADVQQLCNSAKGCNPNEVDPEFGITPLHVARFWGSDDLIEYLIGVGADNEAFDYVGRQPRNMSFPTFSKYSKAVGRKKLPPGADSQSICEIPEVVIPVWPATTSDSESTGDEVEFVEWTRDVEAALSEVRRLVSEGEPIMVRNMLPWLLVTAEHEQVGQTASLKYGDASSFVQAWGHRPVNVGSVPYARNFNLEVKRMALRDYYDSSTGIQDATSPNGEHVLLGEKAPSEKTDAHSLRPNYVFEVDPEACGEGRDLLERVVVSVLPSEGERPLICPPSKGLLGLKSVHYFLGRIGTGAPHHIHSDALNLVISGRKKWWVLTPRNAVWGRRHVLEYAEEGEGGPWKDAPHHHSADMGDSSPMECTQGAGDLVYVPAEWGHAAVNLEDDTFGYTLELVNRRETLAAVIGKGCVA